MAPHHIVKKLISSTAIGFATAVTVACSPIKTLNVIVPNNGFTLHADIAYGDSPRQKLDVYQPKQQIENAQKKPPVVLFYYGGSWDSGDKDDYKFAAEAFASNGFVAVIPDYRVYPEVVFPGFMADPAKAAKWVKDHIQEFDGDPNRVFLAGHSAGAQIAVMLSLNYEYLAKENLKPTDFRGTIGLAGPYDFLPVKTDRLKKIFGPADQRWKSQPIEFVTGKNQPMLLLVGLKDGTVWPRNTFNLAAKIKAKGGPVQVVEFPNYGHSHMVSKLAKPLRGNGELLKPIVDFINSHSQ
ncbi:MAG TPA: alpha/beta hydrolase [Methylotenera sp.]|nr:alpha/beta hydrolase [Methylotenera sp.]